MNRSGKVTAPHDEIGPELRGQELREGDNSLSIGRVLVRLGSFLRLNWLTVFFAFSAFCATVWLSFERTPEAWLAVRNYQASFRELEATIFLAAGVRTALIAILFSAIYLITVKIVGGTYRLLADMARGRPAMQFLLELLTYFLFVATALLPMSLLMEFDSIRDLDQDNRAIILLLMINGLFFFLGISYVDFTITESHKSYATSAEFKSIRRASMTSEASWHFLISRWASVYFFVLTFTMVPETIEGGTKFMFSETFGDNIVKSIFYTLFNEGSGSSLFWLQICAFVATALLFRLMIEVVVFATNIAFGLEGA